MVCSALLLCFDEREFASGFLSASQLCGRDIQPCRLLSEMEFGGPVLPGKSLWVSRTEEHLEMSTALHIHRRNIDCWLLPVRSESSTRNKRQSLTSIIGNLMTQLHTHSHNQIALALDRDRRNATFDYPCS